MSVPPSRGDSPGHLTVNDEEERVGLRDVLHTLAYSFVDKDRLFLRPTVRGRGVNVSIEEVTWSRGARVLLLALTQRPTMRDLNVYNFKRALPRMVLFLFSPFSPLHHHSFAFAV
jgi:hypothetical protein